MSGVTHQEIVQGFSAPPEMENPIDEGEEEKRKRKRQNIIVKDDIIEELDHQNISANVINAIKQTPIIDEKNVITLTGSPSIRPIANSINHVRIGSIGMDRANVGVGNEETETILIQEEKGSTIKESNNDTTTGTAMAMATTTTTANTTNDVNANADITTKDKDYEDYMRLDEDYQMQFKNNMESLINFKFRVEVLTRDFLADEDVREDTFMQEILACNVSQFHNQVPKVLLFITISVGGERTYRSVRQLLDNMCAKKIVNELQLLSAFRRLFHRVNEMAMCNPKSYDALVEFGEYCVDKGHLESMHLKDLIRQTEFARDHERVDRLKKRVRDIIDEYFSSADVDDAVKSVKDMGTRFYSFEVVKQVISTSMDRDNRCRELTSKFLSSAVGDGPDDAIDRQSAELGFSVLLQRVEDLYKDVPDVLHYLSCFVARAIVDEVLPRSYLHNVHVLETDMGYAVISRAQNLLRGKYANARLQNVWGISSQKSVKELKTAIHDIVREFLVNEDINEAIDSVHDLNVPLFSHEIVKQFVAGVADYLPVNLDEPVSDTVRLQKAQLVAKMLVSCVKNNIIPGEEIEHGFQCIKERISDLKLDSPQIEKYYNEIALKFNARH